MAAVQRKLVHKQFNSPMGLYSQQNVKDTLKRELHAFGSDGIEIDDQIAKPLNLANSAVLRAVEEEEQQQMKCGYKRVAWPPASEERIVREFTPQPQTQYQPVPAYNDQQQQPGAAVPSTQGPIYNNVPPHQHQHQNLSNAPNNTNNTMARETISPYNQNQNQYEAYPPQQPETPIVLVDKQFSRQASHEPIQTNSAPYQQQQYQQQGQQQQQYHQPPMVQPQNQSMQQQQQHQPSYNQQIHQQQYQPNNQQNVSYPQQQQYQQQTPLQQQPPQNSPSTPVTGWKPIQPPQPKQDSYFTSPTGVNETTTTPTPVYQQQFQNYHQQPQQQQYRAPSHDTHQQPQQQYQQPPQQQYSPQPQYQAPIQNQYQQPQQPQGQVPQYQQPQQPQGQVPQYQQPQQQYQQPPWVQQPQQQAAQQQYQQPPWVQQPQQQPAQQQYQQPPQQQQQPQYQTPLNQFQAPHQQQQYQPQPQPNQFVSQPNQQFNSYSQPQQQQHTVSHDQLDNLRQQSLPQDYRGGSPGIITLRKEAPVTQAPAPVYTSQPAAVSYQELSTDDILGGCNMRGDLKWPPPEYKEAAVKENEERRQLAAGPVCRPRKVKRDYNSFFAKNALSHHYPSYKVPPGTQHMTY